MALINGRMKTTTGATMTATQAKAEPRTSWPPYGQTSWQTGDGPSNISYRTFSTPIGLIPGTMISAAKVTPASPMDGASMHPRITADIMNGTYATDLRLTPHATDFISAMIIAVKGSPATVA